MSAWSDYVAAITNLVGWWRLADLTDSSGNARTLTSVAGTSGAPVAATSLLPYDTNGAMSFPGGGARLTTPSMPIGATWSACVLLRVGANPTATQTLLSLNAADSPNNVFLAATGALAFQPAGGPQASAGTGWTDGQPHLAVATFDGSIVRIYRDGVQAVQVTASTPATVSLATNVVRTIGGANGAFVGVLDEAALVARAISAQEVTSLWTAMHTGPPTLTAISPTSGNVAGGMTVTLTGTQFITGTTVSIGGIQVTPTITSSTSLTFVTPPRAAGAASVTVTTTYGTSGALTFTYTATVPAAPTSVVATAGVESASLSWTAPASDGGSPITGYVVSWPDG